MIAAVKLGQCLTQFLSVGAFNRDMLTVDYLKLRTEKNNYFSSYSKL